ncbi:hypothetical protein E2C01_036918 [Portunus trituberculatus]|uniref:Uncharacterized protein n=1 Tax=Portunus trituberculatus TaxID=210409 RepID=A0A5B7FD85_PORTR|nr:hypothetical protein [Portunus trituberculatus]
MIIAISLSDPPRTHRDAVQRSSSVVTRELRALSPQHLLPASEWCIPGGISCPFLQYLEASAAGRTHHVAPPRTLGKRNTGR